MQGLIASTDIQYVRVGVRLREAGRFASKSTVSASLNKRQATVLLDVFLDRDTQEKLVEYCRKNSFDLSTGFVKATERGMRFFRAVYYKEMKQDYLLLKKLAEGYENDSRALKQLEKENQTLRQILNAHQRKARECEIET